MSHRPCPFCDPPAPVLENDLAAVVRDNYPVNPGHLLVIPKRHTADWFSLTDDERTAVNALLLEARAWLDREHQPDGFNIGMNCGEAADRLSYALPPDSAVQGR